MKCTPYKKTPPCGGVSGSGSAPDRVIRMVGMAGFEPTTSRSRTERSTKLSHIPARTYAITTGATARGAFSRTQGAGSPLAERAAHGTVGRCGGIVSLIAVEIPRGVYSPLSSEPEGTTWPRSPSISRNATEHRGVLRRAPARKAPSSRSTARDDREQPVGTSITTYVQVAESAIAPAVVALSKGTEHERRTGAGIRSSVPVCMLQRRLRPLVDSGGDHTAHRP